MIEDLKTLLGEGADSFTDAQIALALKMALAEVEAYCKRPVDAQLEFTAMKIAVIKLNRTNTEGLAGQGYSGVSESYIDGYPQDIQMILRGKRKLKVV
jgi:hypothetical protein